MDPYFKDKNYWGLILGGSSGIGLGIAHKMATEGMNLIILHRDRKQSANIFMEKVDKMRAEGIKVITKNVDALREEERQNVIQDIQNEFSPKDKIRLLIHAISRGNLKPMVDSSANNNYLKELPPVYQSLKSQMENSQKEVKGQLSNTDMSLTLQAMALSLYDWVKEVHENDLFATDSRVIGLTSEGSQKTWRSYAAVSTAKAALEAIGRSIALEYACHGIRCNILQPGVTDTPSFRMIPGSEHIKANTQIRNPFSRLTTPDDVANVVYLLSRDEAAWINGAIIPVDGGEKNC